MRSLLVAFFIVRHVIGDQSLLNDFIEYQTGAYGSSPNQTYRSSNITSPWFNYNTWNKDLLSDDENSHILLTLNYAGVGAGPYIFRDDDLSLVYADTSFGTTMNARVQTVNDTQYLTFWHGDKRGGHGKGHCVFYNDRYELKYNLSIQAPLTVDVDMHECQVTSSGTVLLTAYQDKPANLSSFGYTGNDILADSCFQEVDLVTNEMVFTWCASDWFSHDLTYQNFTKREERQYDDDDVANSHAAPATGVDAYHINSLQKTAQGHYLVSLRPLHMITYIDGTTGKPIWNLNGRLNNFTDVTPASVLETNVDSGGALSFGWQHTTRFMDDSLTTISLFDNHKLTTRVGCSGRSCSRGRILQIDTSDPGNLTVELIQDFRSPQGLNSLIMGSMQTLPSGSEQLGNAFIGWGANAEFGEYTAEGEIVRDVQFSVLDPRNAFGGFGGVSSYRAYKQSWRGYPTWPPSIATDDSGRIWVSWNGATEVRWWAVYGSHRAGALGSLEGNGYRRYEYGSGLGGVQPLIEVERAGFETDVFLGLTISAFVKVAALDDFGKIIGMTETVRPSTAGFGCGIECRVLESILLP